MDFYTDVIQQPAGTLQADSRLCQTIERITIEVHNAKGEVTRVITREKLGLPSKCEAGLALRQMCGWDKKPDAEPEDDISELLIMIRKRSSSGNALSEKAAATVSEPFQGLPQLPPGA